METRSREKSIPPSGCRGGARKTFFTGRLSACIPPCGSIGFIFYPHGAGSIEYLQDGINGANARLNKIRFYSGKQKKFISLLSKKKRVATPLGGDTALRGGGSDFVSPSLYRRINSVSRRINLFGLKNTKLSSNFFDIINVISYYKNQKIVIYVFE